ncbi:hypothetical protein L1987_84498 [Smallanthus sonchifolius]|uniref:Uncharacterized protein n=1 Tax=Smallanthus sonchifolius TaxID=185202 RepID=A0ACB8YFK2_9ASTR|nr:hypothetical protein L1987_84498 [Smallanthus sonchifolius]
MVDTRKSTNFSSQCKDGNRLNDDRCFKTIMAPYYIKTTRLNVPMKFARSNGLITERMHTQVVLVDEAQRSWQATLIIKTPKIRLTDLGKKPTKNHIKVQKETISRIKKVEKSSTRYFISTLTPYSFKTSRLYVPAEFSIANDLRIGEMILRDDKGRSWKVQLNKMVNVESKPSRQENHIALKDTSSTRKETSSNRYFISTLKPYSFKKSCLYLPVEFSISNDLRMGEMILRDDKGRLDFWVANCLTEGDAYKFELIENEKDKPPIVNFSCTLFSISLFHFMSFEFNPT